MGRVVVQVLVPARPQCAQLLTAGGLLYDICKEAVTQAILGRVFVLVIAPAGSTEPGHESTCQMALTIFPESDMRRVLV